MVKDLVQFLETNRHVIMVSWSDFNSQQLHSILLIYSLFWKLMITFFPNTPKLLCSIKFFQGFIRGVCPNALDKQTPIYYSKFINLKLLKLAF